MKRTYLIAVTSAAALAMSTGACASMQTGTSADSSRPDMAATPGQTGTMARPTAGQTGTMTSPTPGQTTMPMTPAPGQSMTPSDMPMSGQTNQSTGAMTDMTPGQSGAAAADASVSRGTLLATAMGNQNLSTFVKAVQAAGIGSMLSSGGPYTVFAPVNDAFNRLAPGAMDTLMKPENKSALTKVLQYHVVNGRYTNAQLKQMVTQGGGTATLTTLEGEPLKLSIVNGNIALQGVNGNKSYLTTPGSAQPSGILHIVNGVLVPNLGGGSSSASDNGAGSTGN